MPIAALEITACRHSTPSRIQIFKKGQRVQLKDDLYSVLSDAYMTTGRTDEADIDKRIEEILGSQKKTRRGDGVNFAHFPLLDSTAVVKAVAGSFTAVRDDFPELAVATCDRIYLFSFDEDAEPKQEWTFKHPGILGMHVLRKR